MATISGLVTSLGNGEHMANSLQHVPYKMEVEIDFAEALADKGSALAAEDIIECIAVPAGSVVWGGGIEVLEPDDASTLTLDLGVTAIDADAWVDGFNHAAGAAGAYSQFAAAYQPIVIGATADTVDLYLATLTGTLSVGKCRVWIELTDISAEPVPSPAKNAYY